MRQRDAVVTVGAAVVEYAHRLAWAVAGDLVEVQFDGPEPGARRYVLANNAILELVVVGGLMLGIVRGISRGAFAEGVQSRNLGARSRKGGRVLAYLTVEIPAGEANITVFDGVAHNSKWRA